MEGYIKEDEPPLPTDKDMKQSKVFSIGTSRREGGNEFNSVLFVRHELVRLHQRVMAFWNDPRKVKLYVKGPPGCGKTCFFYLWARLRSVQEDKSVLIIQFRPLESSFIWIREKGGELFRLAKAVRVNQLTATVDEILEERRNAGKNFDLCIHDGVLQNEPICGSMLSTLNSEVTAKLITKVIHVTSLAFALTTGGQVLGSFGEIVRLSLNSWCLQDYFDAINCRVFVEKVTATGSSLSKDLSFFSENSEDNPEADNTVDDNSNDDMMSLDGTGVEAVSLTNVVETKYFYAGGSARFMFDFPFEHLKEELDERLGHVPEGDWKYFAAEAVSPSTPSSVNTLIQQFDNSTSPVSKYILFHAYDRCKTKLVRSVKAAAQQSNNPALKGWAFELCQIDLIRLSLESPAAKPEYITNNDRFHFYPQSSVDYTEKTLENGTIEDKEGGAVIIWCMKWNQACFDVALYQHKTLVTIQFTVAEEHSLKPNFIRRLRDQLMKQNIQVERVVHVGVRDGTEFKFKLETVGTGRQGNAREPQFTIFAYHSLPLVNKAGTIAFQASFASVLEEVPMWELAATKTG